MASLSHTLVPSAVFLVALGAASVAGARFAGASSPDVQFSAVGPVGMKIDGETNDLSVADDGTSVTVDVPLSRLHTGISLRDRHMRDKYLEVEKYPDAKLIVTRSALRLPADGASLDADARGELVLHGRKKEVPFHYSAHRAGDSYSVAASLRVDMRDFGIEVPSYLGVTVKPAVHIAVRFSVRDR